MRLLPGRLGAFTTALVVAVLLAACTSEPSPPATGAPPSPGASTPDLAGSPDWPITHPGPPHGIEGFADRVSVLPGQPVRLFVSTTARRFTVTAYRMGNYRDSAARQTWKSDPQPGVTQAASVLQQPTNTVVAPWQPSLTVDTSGWQAGDYLLRLDGDNATQQFVPLTVRAQSNAGRIVIVNAVTTWQAYNSWGGYSLYDSPTGKYAQRSRAVSFDRPYQADTMQGAGDFLYFELPLLLFAERSGLQIGYATDVDLHADPQLLAGARGVVTLGHDEYWSAAMRDNVTQARDNGVNLAFLGGNEIYRHIRFDATPLGTNRLEVGYKSFAEDPMSKTDPREATPQWRSPPISRPESALLGNFYQCNPVNADLVATDVDNWLLKGLVTPGEKFPNMVGNEYEAVDLGVPTPRPLEVLFHSPVTCGGRSGFADATYYTTPSGAAVFSSGTQYWICGVDPGCARSDSPNDVVRHTISTMTTRLLTAFAQGPVGGRHPAVDNLAALGIPGAKPNPAPTLPPAAVGTH